MYCLLCANVMSPCVNLLRVWMQSLLRVVRVSSGALNGIYGPDCHNWTCVWRPWYQTIVGSGAIMSWCAGITMHFPASHVKLHACLQRLGIALDQMHNAAYACSAVCNGNIMHSELWSLRQSHSTVHYLASYVKLYACLWRLGAAPDQMHNAADACTAGCIRNIMHSEL